MNDRLRGLLTRAHAQAVVVARPDEAHRPREQAVQRLERAVEGVEAHDGGLRILQRRKRRDVAAKEVGKDGEVAKHPHQLGPDVGGRVEQRDAVLRVADGALRVAAQKLDAREENADEQHRVQVRGARRLRADEVRDGGIVVLDGKVVGARPAPFGRPRLLDAVAKVLVQPAYGQDGVPRRGLGVHHLRNQLGPERAVQRAAQRGGDDLLVEGQAAELEVVRLGAGAGRCRDRRREKAVPGHAARRRRHVAVAGPARRRASVAGRPCFVALYLAFSTATLAGVAGEGAS